MPWSINNGGDGDTDPSTLNFSPPEIYSGQLTPVQADPLFYSVIKVLPVQGEWNNNKYMVFDIEMDVVDAGWGSDNWILSIGFVHDDDISNFTEGQTVDYNTTATMINDFVGLTTNTVITNKKIKYMGATGNMADGLGNFTIKSKIPYQYDSDIGMNGNQSYSAFTKNGVYHVVIAVTTESVTLTSKTIANIVSLKAGVLEPTDPNLLLKLANAGVDINLKI